MTSTTVSFRQKRWKMIQNDCEDLFVVPLSRCYSYICEYQITKKNLPPKKVARIDNDVDMNANISNSPRRYSNMDVNETCHYYLQVCHDMPKPKWWHQEERVLEDENGIQFELGYCSKMIGKVARSTILSNAAVRNDEIQTTTTMHGISSDVHWVASRRDCKIIVDSYRRAPVQIRS